MVTKADKLRAELAMAEVDEAYLKAKVAGQAKVAKAREAAFSKAKTAQEYSNLVKEIPPALTNDEKLAHRAAVREYREEWRGSPKDGGAVPDPAHAEVT